MLLLTENRIWLDHNHYFACQFRVPCTTPINLVATEKIPKDKLEFKLDFPIIKVQMRSTQQIRLHLKSCNTIMLEISLFPR